MNSDPMVRFMMNSGIPLTRENYLALNWPDGVPDWTAEHECMMPDQFRIEHCCDDRYGYAHDEMIEVSYDARGRVLFIALDAFNPDEPRKQDGEWTAGAGGGDACNRSRI
jgi:hypothetical protein